jgi:mRNA-degrading endonuclease YafQ of YafQ-DinJ toxin-antitoxin module
MMTLLLIIYVHYFDHQLQPTLVAVAKENINYDWFLGYIVKIFACFTLFELNT